MAKNGKHFLGSFLSGDPATIKQVTSALSGYDITLAEVSDRAQRIADRAREDDDSKSAEIFAEGSSASELIRLTMSDKVLKKLDERGVTGRAMKRDGELYYDGTGKE